ncbi:MAG TPA: hypothetical protein VIV12_08915 [Streptosporangiaceae bacterium]
MTAGGPASAVAALERLATALGAGEFATVLVAGTGRRPHLSVTSRQTQAAEDIYADEVAYWWAWAERISAVADPLTAAHRVAAMVRAVPGPVHDW